MKNKKQRAKQKAKFEISAGGIVYRIGKMGNKEGKIEILLIKDSYGRWAFPKGHLEKGEKVTEAAIREISEETGLKNLEIRAKLDQVKYFFKLKGQLIFKIVYHFLIENLGEEKIKPQFPEIRKARWMNISEVEKLLDYKDLKPVLGKAKRLLNK